MQTVEQDAADSQTGRGDPHKGLPRLAFGFERIGLVSLRVPYLLVIVFVILGIGAAFGLQRLKVDDSLSQLFRSNTPQFRQYEAVTRNFPSSEYDVLVVVQGDKLLQRDSLEKVRDLVTDLQLVDGTRGIISLFSARQPPENGQIPAPLFPEPLPEGQDYQDLVKKVRSNDLIQGKLLSDDGQLALIVLALKPEVASSQKSGAIVSEIRATMARDLDGSGAKGRTRRRPRHAARDPRFRRARPDHLQRHRLHRRLRHRHSLLSPHLLHVRGGGASARRHRPRHRHARLARLPAQHLSQRDDAAHHGDQLLRFHAAHLRHPRQADGRREQGGRDRGALAVVGPACVLTHATAMVSFVALLFSDSDLIRTFGEAGLITTAIALVTVLVLLPLLAILLIRGEAKLASATPSADRAVNALRGFCRWIAERMVGRPGLYSLIGLAVVIALSVVYYRLEPRYRLADQVPNNEQAVTANGSLDKKLTGANPVDVLVEIPQGQTLYSPDTLATIAAVQRAVESQPGIGNVFSLQTLRDWLAQKLGRNDLDTLKQYVGFLPKPLVRRYISEDSRAVLVSGRIPDIDASRLLPTVDALDKRLDAVRAEHKGYDIAVTGLAVIAARNSASMIERLSRGLTIEIVFVAAFIGLAFRSWVVMLLSILPGIFPIVASGALLYAMGEGLQFASVVALTVSFGLGLSATIHFLNRLRLEERADESAAGSVERATILVGPALILTSVVLACGLAVTAFSNLPMLRLFGWLSAFAMMAALTADLLILRPTAMYLRSLVGTRSNI